MYVVISWPDEETDSWGQRSPSSSVSYKMGSRVCDRREATQNTGNRMCDGPCNILQANLSRKHSLPTVYWSDYTDVYHVAVVIKFRFIVQSNIPLKILITKSGELSQLMVCIWSKQNSLDQLQLWEQKPFCLLHWRNSISEHTTFFFPQGCSGTFCKVFLPQMTFN